MAIVPANAAFFGLGIECCLGGGTVDDYAALVPGFGNPTIAS